MAICILQMVIIVRLLPNCYTQEDKHSGNENLNHFISFLIADSNVKIYEFNRIISDLNGHSKEDFIKKVAENFVIKTKKQELLETEAQV